MQVNIPPEVMASLEALELELEAVLEESLFSSEVGALEFACADLGELEAYLDASACGNVGGES